eukprot:CAMPEP_0117529538 /NCGR_PEP_ID=MMETSP0784-20121206/37883_1 /TAXON_ID=39447 /ORGANISM="" /LENGTH=226 /DNA_ID=CAMNT_0005325861 /DNA_START=117 /DNA_END=797 /DNA_ORIENTATION=+
MGELHCEGIYHTLAALRSKRGSPCRDAIEQLGLDSGACTSEEAEFASRLVEIGSVDVHYKRLREANVLKFNEGAQTYLEQWAMLSAMDKFDHLQDWCDACTEQSEDPELSGDEDKAYNKWRLQDLLLDDLQIKERMARNAAFWYDDSMESLALSGTVDEANATADAYKKMRKAVKNAHSAQQAVMTRRLEARKQRRVQAQAHRPKVFVLPSVIALEADVSDYCLGA